MASSTVNATYQGIVGLVINATLVNWVGSVRNGTTATYVNTITNNQTNSSAIYVYLFAQRGGYGGGCYRVPLFFDVSSITASNTISAATLKVWNSLSSQSTQTIVVKGSAWGGSGGTSTLSSGDFDSLDHSTAYSSKDLSWGGNTYNDFSLNATAISDMNTNGYLNCFLIEGDWDYDGQSPALNDGPYYVGLEFLDPTNKIKVELTYSPSGYANNPIGVAAASVGDILGVARASVSKFLGV